MTIFVKQIKNFRYNSLEKEKDYKANYTIIKMSKIGAFFSGLAGVSVLVGYFMPDLNQAYYLIPAGGVLAVFTAFFLWNSRAKNPAH